ncbi:MAG: hypothetical protein KA715_08260 [Xanthomonadaceae bacterium]|nr:hypothetical protein [Xanthomonadaceae bacterium]
MTQTVIVSILLLNFLINAAHSAPKESRDSTIDLFVFRSSTRINFDSPKTLFFSTIKSYITSRIDRILPGQLGNKNESMLGHVSFKYSCGCEDWKSSLRRERMVGHTGQKNNQAAKQIFKGGGLVPSVSIYTDGHLETDQEVQDMLDSYGAHPEMVKVLRLKTSCQVCRNFAQFVDDYESSGAYKNYTLVYQPRAFLKGKSSVDAAGGGCASFTAGALERSGIWGKDSEKIFTDLSFTRKIPFEIITPIEGEGVKLDPVWKSEIEKVSQKKNQFFGPWTNPRWDHWNGDKTLLIVDPEWFYDWINGAIAHTVLESKTVADFPSERSDNSLWLGSSGSLTSIKKQIHQQQILGSNWITPYLRSNKVKWLTSDSPYPKFGTLYVDMTR